MSKIPPGWAVAACLLTVALLFSDVVPQAVTRQAAQVQFVDAASPAGLTVRVVNGGEQTKKYIWESTGSGIAVIDYDRDGFPDLFILSGRTLEDLPKAAEATNHLLHNNRDGTFTDVTTQAGLFIPGGRTAFA